MPANLPPYVFEKPDTGSWFVRKNFRTKETYPNGKPVYTQVVRKCEPKTAMQAALVAEQIDREFGQQAERDANEQESVEGFLRFYLETKAPSVEPRTLEGYEYLFDHYIYNTRFALQPVADLKPMDIQRFYTALGQTASSAMVRKLNAALSAAFNRAVVWEIINKNPCKGVTLPKLKRADEVIVFDRSTARRFMQACYANPDWLVLAFALETGMRPGEYLALQWKSVKADTVKVVRKVSFPKEGGYYYGDPKTKKSKRDISLSDKLTAALAEQRERRERLIEDLKNIVAQPVPADLSPSKTKRAKSKRHHAKLKLAEFTVQDLVFPAETGGPIDPRNLARREMKDACAALGIAPHSIYTLRHSMATLMLMAGTDIKTVSDKLGHASVSTTYDYYGHVLPEMRKKGVDKLAEALY